MKPQSRKYLKSAQALGLSPTEWKMNAMQGSIRATSTIAMVRTAGDLILLVMKNFHKMNVVDLQLQI